MVIIKIERGHVYILVALIAILIGVFVVRAYTNPIPNPGHGGDSVLVIVGNPPQEKTLQAAIDDKDITVSKRFDGLDDVALKQYPGFVNDVCVMLNSGNPWGALIFQGVCDNTFCNITKGYEGGTGVQIRCDLKTLSCLCV